MRDSLRQPRTALRQRGSTRKPSKSWTEERIRCELKEVLGGAREWPSYAEFQRHGKKSLRDAVTHFGGARLWAAKLGLTYVERHPGYAPIWTEERIRSELDEFLRGRDIWPRRNEFEAAGKKALRDAVQRSGGPERWAAAFKLPRIDERSGSRRVWTDERIQERLRLFLSDRSGWPSRAQFLAAGQGPLLAAIFAWGGAEKWARRVGRTAPRSQSRRREFVWPEERIRKELAEFCRGRDHWPRFSEFRAAGKLNLYQAASRNGGVDRWIRELGLAK